MRALVEGAHHEAWEILVEYRDVLDDMVLKLLDKETLTKEEVLEIFASVEKRPQREHPTGGGKPPAVRQAPGAHAGRARRHGPGRPRGPRPRAQDRQPQAAPMRKPARSRSTARRAPRSSTARPSDQVPPAKRTRAPRRAPGTDPAS